MSAGATTYFTQGAGLNEVNQLVHSVRRLLAKFHTALPVKVIACTNAGTVSAVGTVTLQILVNQVDGAGNTLAAGALLYNVPYSRVQGGANAVICDPVANDIGCAVFAERDISIVMANYGAGNPGSNRRNSISDAMYVGMFPNVVPTQYIQFLSNGGGINIESPTAIQATVGTTQLALTTTQLTAMAGGCGFTVSASGTAFTGPVTGNQTATFQGEGTFNGGHTVSAHTHEMQNIQTGSTTKPTETPTG